MTGPRAWATIDLAAIRHNAALLAEAAGPASLCAVVKADGYGHGAVDVANAALQAGASRLGVAQVQEGVVLREAGIAAPIIVLSEPGATEFVTAASYDLEPTVYTAAAIESARRLHLRVHLKVDTGMRRSGCALGDAVGLARSASPASVWTHLAVADEPTHPHNRVQLARYDAVLASLAAAGIEVPLRHAANTAACLLHPDARYDMVRCGIGLYGLAPSPAQRGGFDLRPAMRLETTVSFVKRLAAGERLSYGLRGAVEKTTTVATLPIGYADGVRRSLWKEGSVLIGGIRRRILGVVTMDQMIVDCGDDDVRVGDEAVLIGRQGCESITADSWAEWLDTINYEVVCGISPRVGRRLADDS
ncbi:MAG: alanine racemase [Acidimicrobiales bacterium]